MSEWISVDDRLPGIGEHVLTAGYRCYIRLRLSDGRTVLRRDSRYDGTWWSEVSWREADVQGETQWADGLLDVSHWMPLPGMPDGRRIGDTADGYDKEDQDE